MKEQLMALYELQDLDVKIARANDRLAALGTDKTLKQKYSAVKKELEAVQQALHAVETDLKDSELKLKSIDEKRTNFEKRLYGGSVSNPKELGSIEKEIKMLKDQQSKLDVRTLELYDQVEAARAKAQVAEQMAADLEKKIRAAQAQAAAEKVALESELAELMPKRAAEVAKVTDRVLLTRYETVRKRTGATGIAKIKENRCEACRIAVKSYDTRRLFEDKELVNCESCGRILMMDVNE